MLWRAAIPVSSRGKKNVGTELLRDQVGWRRPGHMELWADAATRHPGPRRLAENRYAQHLPRSLGRHVAREEIEGCKEFVLRFVHLIFFHLESGRGSECGQNTSAVGIQIDACVLGEVEATTQPYVNPFQGNSEKSLVALVAIVAIRPDTGEAIEMRFESPVLQLGRNRATQGSLNVLFDQGLQRGRR